MKFTTAAVLSVVLLVIAVTAVEVQKGDNELVCYACKKIIGKFYGEVADKGCDLAAKPAATSLCSAVFSSGSLSELCEKILVDECAKIVEMVEEGIKDPEKICKAIGMC